MEPKTMNTAREGEALPGELPLADVSADGGGQRTEVGSPYDGSGGVVLGTERWLQSDHKGKLAKRWEAVVHRR